jgi:hypothetical protein
VLDYQSTQLKLLPILATTYCLHFAKDHLVGWLAGALSQCCISSSFTGFMAPGSSIWWNWYTWHAGRIAYAVPAPA